MHRLVVTYFQPDDPEHFRKYHKEVHMPLGDKIPGVQAMHCSYEVRGLPVPALKDAQVPFCVFMADWLSEDEMIAAMTSPEGQAVTADVENYATGGCSIYHYEL